MQLTPPEWVMYPYLKAVRKLIRPPTARTRRKQVKVSVPFSRSCFEHLMAQMQENDVDDLERPSSRPRRSPSAAKTGPNTHHSPVHWPHCSYMIVLARPDAPVAMG